MFPRWPATVVLALAVPASTASAQIAFHCADYPSHPGARAIVSADFNRDGWIDVAHANTGRNTVTILLNQRDPAQALRLHADVPVGTGPFDLAAADFNRDNVPDLVVANADNDTISVLIGDGSGSFSRTDVVAQRNPRGVTVADINRDAKPDIVYTGFLNNRVQVLLGNGSGGFSDGGSVTGVANMPQGIAAADFNNDGRVDLAVAYAGTDGGLAVLTQTATGSWSARRISSEPLNVVTAADLNRDGWMDAAAASTGYNRMETFYGGTAGLNPQRSYLTGSSPRGIGAADINQDGWIDIVVANKESNTVTVFRAPPHPNGWHVDQHFSAGRGSRGVAVGDFDHDGLVDVATGNQDEGSVTLLSNVTSLVPAGFAFTRLDGGYGFDFFFDEVVLADFDRDGRLDRVTHGGTIDFGNGNQSQLPHAVRGVQPADVNRDGRIDLVYVDHDGRVIRTMLGDGLGGFSEGAAAGGWAAGFFPSARSLNVGDVDRDGDIDVLLHGNVQTGNVTEGFLYVYKGNGDGSFAAPVVTATPGSPFSWIGDVDGDAKIDFLFAHFRPTDELGVAFGDGAGGFSRIVQYPGPGVPSSAVVADVNRDGRPDVVTGGFDGTSVYLGQPGGTLGAPATELDGSYRVSLADFDHDGNLDIIGNSTAQIRFGRGDGTFGVPQRFAAFGAYPVGADMNNDGLTDIVVGDGVGVLLNRRQATNTVPTVRAPDDVTIRYEQTAGDEDDAPLMTAVGFDADLHDLRYEWRDANGTLLRYNMHLSTAGMNPGTYHLTVTVFDDRGGSATDSMVLTILPLKEIVLHAAGGQYNVSGWETVADATAASGVRAYDPNQGTPKVNTPLAEPASYFEIWFLADPTQDYKLWIRGKADGNYWGNDSAWVQFEHSLNTAGAPAYRIGTTDALPFNLEECSGCGISGWGWEDDGWGRVDQHGTTIRFAQGGWQRLRIQRREDGLSIDQIVLSAERYLTTRPGTAKNDTTILPRNR